VQVNGKELTVDITGEGPAVLLVHGLGGTSSFYQPQVTALSERFQVIRPDMEGSGRSPVNDDCGHWTALERPFEVTEHLLKFF